MDKKRRKEEKLLAREGKWAGGGGKYDIASQQSDSGPFFLFHNFPFLVEYFSSTVPSYIVLTIPLLVPSLSQWFVTVCYFVLSQSFVFLFSLFIQKQCFTSLSTLVCCQPTELFWVFLFHKTVRWSDEMRSANRVDLGLLFHHYYNFISSPRLPSSSRKSERSGRDDKWGGAVRRRNVIFPFPFHGL